MLQPKTIPLLLYILPLVFQTSTSTFIYTAVSSKVIRPHSTFEVYISVEESTDGPVEFEVIISPEENNNKTIVQDYIEIPSRTSAALILTLGSLPEEFYNLTIKATPKKDSIPLPHDPDNGIGSPRSLYYPTIKKYRPRPKPRNRQDSNLNEQSATLHVDKKDISILIQTDKPIYKPGEVVQFRVIFLNRYLKPAESSEDKPIKIEVLDSQRNIIKSWKKVELDNKFSLIKKTFELSKEPNLGEWTVDVSVGKDEKESHQFTIDQYVLPKFKVEVKAKPSFVTYNNSKFIVELASTYTHGKGVKGPCTLVLKHGYYDYWIEDDINIYNGDGKKKEKRPRFVSKTKEVDGKADFEFDLKSDLKIKPEDANDYGNEYRVEVSCMDQASGKVQNASLSINLYKYPYKISVAEQPQQYKPGFPLTLTLKVSTQDDIPISDPDEDALKIQHGFAYQADEGSMNKSIPPSGLVTLTFTTPTNEYIQISGMDVTYKELSQYISIPVKQNSPTKTYMQLSRISTSENKPLMALDTIYITVKVNKPFQSANYILISRGAIVKYDMIIFPSLAMEQMISLNLPSNISSETRLMVFTVIAPLNEVVVDSLTLSIKPSMDRHLQIQVKGVDTVEPGTNISIQCNGFPSSLVALRGVDQSVLLLKQDKDVSESSLQSIEGSFDQVSSIYRSWGGSEAFQMFEQAGIHIFTNGLLKKQEEYPVAYAYNGGSGFLRRSSMKMMAAPEPMGRNFMASGGAANMEVMEDSMSISDSSSGGAGADIAVRVRKSFPETWIFLEVESPDGKVTVENTVPDTITSWVLNGFQISPEEGIGVAASTTKLTVFRPFFISLNLPYSVIKGEVLSLQVLVHNYMPGAVLAKVTIDNSEGQLEIFGPNKEVVKHVEITKSIKIEASSVTVVSFLISPKIIGTVTLNLKAVTSIAGDALSQPLIVKPPGVKQTKNSALFLNLLTERNITRNISAVFPEQRVKDGDVIKISVIGDILGGTINNLDRLIELPRGCGEQNMLNFVPDIVILDYLNATDSLTIEIHEKVKRFLETGYQQELTYKRYDGSFSAFGNSDHVGSTWLTSFVIKAFISAKRFINIDEMVITSALEFLNLQQTEKGSFLEEGYVHDLGLQGGVKSSPYALTAYTLLTFVEAKKFLPLEKFNYSKIIDSGVNWLIQETQGKITDSYAINLITYLLHVIDHKEKDVYFKYMEDHAQTDKNGEFKHWQARPEVESPDKFSNKKMLPMWQPWESMVKPSSVEMTSYALLTYLIREGGSGHVNESFSIAKWLMKQRNEAGGFLSTQDTVVGVTALAKFAEVTRTSNFDMKITVSWKADTGKSAEHLFHIGKDEMTTLQEYFLPLKVREVDVNAKGMGTALAQLTWTYYTEMRANGSGFLLDLQMNPKDKNRRLELKICSTYLEPGKSNMAILEVNTPTGYSFDSEELIELRTNIQIVRHELEDRDTKLNIYYRFLEEKKESCVQLKAHRLYLIAKHSQASVALYDYYDVTRKARKFYGPPKIDICQICALDSTCEIKNCV